MSPHAQVKALEMRCERKPSHAGTSHSVAGTAHADVHRVGIESCLLCQCPSCLELLRSCTSKILALQKVKIVLHTVVPRYVLPWSMVVRCSLRPQAFSHNFSVALGA